MGTSSHFLPGRQMARGPWEALRLWLDREPPWSLRQAGAALVLKTAPPRELAAWEMESEDGGSAGCLPFP